MNQLIFLLFPFLIKKAFILHLGNYKNTWEHKSNTLQHTTQRIFIGLSNDVNLSSSPFSYQMLFTKNTHSDSWDRDTYEQNRSYRHFIIMILGAVWSNVIAKKSILFFIKLYREREIMDAFDEELQSLCCYVSML